MGKRSLGVLTLVTGLLLIALLVAGCASGYQSFSTYLSTLTVGGATTLNGATTINNNAAITGTLGVDGTTTLDGATTINNNAVITGTLGVGGAQTNTGMVKITGPTAAATATPAMILNNLGSGNNILEVQDSGTPVFRISNAGAITGNVLQYGSSGQKIVCNTSTITGTGTLAHGLATPVVVMANLAGDAAGDHARLSTTNASATVTVKIWNSALTPAPATTPVAVDWCVIGTP